MSLSSMYGAAAETSPLIRPRSEPRPPSPRGGRLSKRLLPSGEAAARRRLMRGGVISIVHLRGCCGNIAPHPASVGASATFPLAGEGSPQKASPFGRSCRPQAADEGRRCLYCPFTGLLRKHRPSSDPRPPSPQRGKTHLLSFKITILSCARSLGDTPGIRPAWANVLGLIFASFSRDSSVIVSIGA